VDWNLVGSVGGVGVGVGVDVSSLLSFLWFLSSFLSLVSLFLFFCFFVFDSLDQTRPVTSVLLFWRLAAYRPFHPYTYSHTLSAQLCCPIDSAGGIRCTHYRHHHRYYRCSKGAVRGHKHCLWCRLRKTSCVFFLFNFIYFVSHPYFLC
jgi:hypothetical protein